MLWPLEILYAVIQFFVDVEEAGRRSHTNSHAEAHPMGLPWAMVGVLAKDDHFHLQDKYRVAQYSLLFPVCTSSIAHDKVQLKTSLAGG